MAQSGIELSTAEQIDVVSMYSTASESILAVSAEPGWNIVGTFPMPVDASVRLDLIGSVSDASLTMTARLFCVSPGNVGEVLGSRAQINSTIDVEQFSGSFLLAGGLLYQVQAQIVGNEGDDYFGTVRRAAPVG